MSEKDGKAVVQVHEIDSTGGTIGLVAKVSRELPDGAVLEERHLRGADVVRVRDYLELWRGEIVKGKKLLWSITYAAKLATEGEEPRHFMTHQDRVSEVRLLREGAAAPATRRVGD